MLPPPMMATFSKDIGKTYELTRTKLSKMAEHSVADTHGMNDSCSFRELFRNFDVFQVDNNTYS